MVDSFFIDDASAARPPVRLSPAIAQGAAGTIHHLVGKPGMVVKLYKEVKDLPKYREKIAAMLAAPPHLPAFSTHGRTYVQIAWPTAGVIDGCGEFRGFVMPEIDFQASTELENILQRSARQRKQLREFYGARVLLAANLAALMAELHGLGHYMVDMKPMNMRFYPQEWYMAILDTDGFSINGPRRFPAQQFSDEYIAPEARGKKPDLLGLEQDLFALAVIVFRLLNNGIHPFQGIDRGSAQYPTTLQERIFAGLYAYSRIPHSGVGPSRSSIHEYLEDRTRELFDRAFRSAAARPTAKEWRDHLNGLITSKALVKCAVNPDDHAHFSKGCGLCALKQTPQMVQSSANVLSALSTSTARSGGASHRTSQTGPGSRQAAPAVGTPSRKSRKKLVLSCIGGCALVLGLYIVWPKQEQQPALSPPNGSSTPTDRSYSSADTTADQGTIQNYRPNQTSGPPHNPPTPVAPTGFAGPATPGSDTSLLRVNGHTVKLNGVVGMGSQYVGQLRAFFAEHGNRVNCKPDNDAAFSCYLGKIDIGHVVVRNGAGRAEGARYLEEEERARAEQRGIWAR